MIILNNIKRLQLYFAGLFSGKKDKKILFFSALLFCFFLFAPFGSQAQYKEPQIVNIYFFYGDGCPHCAAEEKFFDVLSKDFSNIEIHRYEVWYDSQNIKLMGKVAEQMNINSGSVPLTIIGERIINGYLSDSTTGQDILRAVEYYTAIGDTNTVGGIINSLQTPVIDNNKKISNMPEKIAIPFFGDIDIHNMSLVGLTVVIGALDGFNPCAMWVLVFLISMLLGVPSRKRQWAIGLVFIFTSGFVYFLFMAAWLNIFLFIGFLFWIRLIIGMVAIASGIYQLREFFVNKEAACKVVDPQKRQKITDRIRKIVQEKSVLLAFFSVVGLAAAVNMVELVCSAGLPAIYTSILSASGLPVWQYYAYLVFYIILYMLDDVIIFAIAMLTLKFVGATKKYVRAANLIGGLVIFLIGILLIFKPSWLLFG